MPNHEVIRQGKVTTLYDPSLLSQIGDWLFDPAQLQARGLLVGSSSGRRSAYFLKLDDKDFVLRHFWRGGLVGRWIRDSYLWTGFARTRPVREWRLLGTLATLGLPVPRPAAVRIERRGLLYHADLITVRLPGTRTLIDVLQHGALSPTDWRRIGAALRKLHRHGAFHSDLNARNILLDEQQRVYVIDWDRGALRRPGRWQQRNLERLLRSLRKEAGRGPLHFDDAEFAELVAGYAADSV